MKVRKKTHEERLSRIGEDCRSGGAARAELELFSWLRDVDCPIEARVLLGAMWAKRGEIKAARGLFRHVHEKGAAQCDSTSLQLLISLLMSCDLMAAARKLGQAIYDTWGDRAEVLQWLKLMEVPGAETLGMVHEHEAEQLANELRVQFANDAGMVWSLVYALKHEMKVKSALLLRKGLLRVVDGIVNDQAKVIACWSLAELAMLMGDHEDVRKWAEAGLSIDPYHAAMAILLSQTGEPIATNIAREKLEVVAEAHPAYPDVRSALIRRQFADGYIHDANRAIDEWLKNDPGNRLAEKLRDNASATETHEGVAA
ncbi:hypothetical protein KS4_27220 [Poriferisphaera corsica]|uniref:Uncharacterized protein n=1 Tax=Poriferisphaera corsica TaxID=2528020 RepID=A0A517YWN7_9BACT|nr:hypothetical protein [Poriferisphaera corsica]QDU34651.1 hypothetical protein KS4_27220 [Poriferisphaera corsica]